MKFTNELIDHAVQLVSEGMTVKAAAGALNVSPDNLSKYLRARGVDTTAGKRRPAHNRIELCAEEIAAMYQKGISENAISKQLGIARAVIRRHLLAAGVILRTQSEAEALKWAQMGETQRAHQVEAAHIATTGIKRGHAELVKRARTKERRPHECLFGMGEAEFAEALRNLGADFVQQKAVGKYNLDFALGSVAVELSTYVGRTMASGCNRERIEYLAERGYKTLHVFADCAESFVHFARDVIAYADLIDRNNAPAGDYWVVRCRRQGYTIVKNERHQFARVSAPVKFVYLSGARKF